MRRTRKKIWRATMPLLLAVAGISACYAVPLYGAQVDDDTAVDDDSAGDDDSDGEDDSADMSDHADDDSSE